MITIAAQSRMHKVSIIPGLMGKRKKERKLLDVSRLVGF
jgi:hypothetical protein